MILRLRYTLLLICLTLSQRFVAQNLSIQAALDRADMKTGEQAVIDVTIRTPDVEQTKYHLIEPVNHDARFLVLSFGATDTIDLEGSTKEIRAKMLITSFDSTLISIPPIMAVYGSDTAVTAPLALSVIQPQVDLQKPDEIKDIKDLWEVNYTWGDIIWLVLGSPFLWIAVILVFASYGFYRYRRYKARKPKKVIAPKNIPSEKTPSQELEEILQMLEGRVYYSQEDYKELYSTLIDALKNYLYKTEGWAWHEMTSSEIRSFLHLTEVEVQLKQSINTLMSDADMSKFAKRTPSEADVKASIRTTRDVAQAVDLRIKARLNLIDRNV